MTVPLVASAQEADPSTLTVSIPGTTLPQGTVVPVTVTLHIGDDVIEDGPPPYSAMVEVYIPVTGYGFALTEMSGGYPGEVCDIDDLNTNPYWTTCTISFTPGDADFVFTLDLQVPAEVPVGYEWFIIYGNTHSSYLLPTVQDDINPVISAAEPGAENSIITTVTPSPASGDAPLDVDWTVTLANDGDEDLTNPLLEYFVGMNTPNVLGPPGSGDTGADGVLGVGETWTWVLQTTEVADATMTVTGSAVAPSTDVITYPADADARAQATVTVNPTPPPVPDIEVPADVTVAASGEEGAVVTYEVEVGDAVESLTCEPPSGSLFPIGTTEVTCTATDFSGNRGVEVFNVTVVAAAATTTTTTAPVTTTTAPATTTSTTVAAVAASTLPATGTEADQTGVGVVGLGLFFGGVAAVASAGLVARRRDEA